MKGGGVIIDKWNVVGWFYTDGKGWGDFRLMKGGGVILDKWKWRGAFTLMERGGVILDWWKHIGHKMGDN